MESDEEQKQINRDTSTTILLQRIHQNDRQALEELLVRLEPKIQKWVRSQRGQLIKRKWDTLDLSQDILMELVRYLPQVRSANSQVLDRILYRMIQNSLCDRHAQLTAARRNIAREQPLGSGTVLDLDPPRDKPETPSEVAAGREQKNWVRLALPLLPPGDEELLLRCKLGRESYVDFAKLEGTTPDAVRMRCNRALTRLTHLVGLLRRGHPDEAIDLYENKSLVEGDEGDGEGMPATI